MMSNDSAYFAKRCEQEMDAADRASSAKATIAHLEMATRYALKAAQAASVSRLLQTS